MKTIFEPKIYQIISILLQYPDDEWFSILPDIKDEINTIENKDVHKLLLEFIEEIEIISQDDLVENYIENFDFGKITNLYVTYLKLREQRERGLELLKLKMFYKSHGFDITDEELPDYLPLMLEFSGNVAKEVSNELLQMHFAAIEEIQKRLKETESYYAVLLDALKLAMEHNGVNMNESVQEAHA
ncbi:nitrate reductase molybdenum cofactor assembly chaperone [Pallidibacillus pasinlerensis]|uniref:Nitrate reductase molybdenum cofactor assembly chaperone n=1 Tax=Pallidibacillus pasinlerensis TaxID=2703818 RepID=A0ABX0A363_9BACI|nr:nitrate reductase molybdenum cofactor assembly chaperone [Pallidibacillus pasinlerensis]NCU17816.1 nitrate reductase molybdenum cofactor assembly chaperone [Pallidibacillus pasinlerensis]